MLNKYSKTVTQDSSQPAAQAMLHAIGLNEDDLKIPHPLIQERKFVLLPLNELNKTFNHPTLNKTNSKMLEDCIDNSNIYLYGDK